MRVLDLSPFCIVSRTMMQLDHEPSSRQAESDSNTTPPVLTYGRLTPDEFHCGDQPSDLIPDFIGGALVPLLLLPLLLYKESIAALPKIAVVIALVLTVLLPELCVILAVATFIARCFRRRLWIRRGPATIYCGIIWTAGIAAATLLFPIDSPTFTHTLPFFELLAWIFIIPIAAAILLLRLSATHFPDAGR